MNELPLESSTPDDHRPLSYADLRRFLLLIAGVVFAVVIVRAIADVLLLFAVVFLLAMALHPIVSWLERRRIPRLLATMLVVVLCLAVTGGVIALVVPPLVDQVQELYNKRTEYAHNLQDQVDALAEQYPQLKDALPGIKKQINDLPNSVSSQAGSIGQTIFKTLGGVVGGLIGGIFLGVLSLLILVFTLSNPAPLLAGFLSAVPPRYRAPARRTLSRMIKQTAAWGKATLVNGTITGVSTGVLLHFVGVKPALVFGLLSFFGEFVPNVGPVVAAAPALLVALSEGPATLGKAALAILFVQQVESNVLVPFVMGKSLELHPVSIVFFALAMAALFGITGAIVAVPTAALCKILFDEFYVRPQGVVTEDAEAEAGQVVRARMSETEE